MSIIPYTDIYTHTHTHTYEYISELGFLDCLVRAEKKEIDFPRKRGETRCFKLAGNGNGQSVVRLNDRDYDRDLKEGRRIARCKW